MNLVLQEMQIVIGHEAVVDERVCVPACKVGSGGSGGRGECSSLRESARHAVLEREVGVETSPPYAFRRGISRKP